MPQELGITKERIRQNLGQPFWKGPDVRLHVPQGEVIIPPCQEGEWYQIEYTLTSDHFFPLEGLDSSAWKHVSEAVKSRDAQSGVNIHQRVLYFAHNQIQPQVPSLIKSFEDYFALGLNYEEFITQAFHDLHHFDLQNLLEEPQIAHFPFSNLSQRPMILRDGKPLFRFYAPLTNPITGHKLIEAVRDGEIIFEGEEGEDWMVGTNKKNGNSIPDGIWTRVPKESELWIPPNNQPFYMDPDTRDYRSYLNQLFQRIPSYEQLQDCNLDPFRRVLKIGETPKLVLSQEIEALIDPDVSSNIAGFNLLEDTAGEHINSYLIDAGSAWPIRVEILSPLADHRDRYVFFSFYRNQ